MPNSISNLNNSSLSLNSGNTPAGIGILILIVQNIINAKNPRKESISQENMIRLDNEAALIDGNLNRAVTDYKKAATSENCIKFIWALEDKINHLQTDYNNLKIMEQYYLTQAKLKDSKQSWSEWALNWFQNPDSISIQRAKDYAEWAETRKKKIDELQPILMYLHVSAFARETEVDAPITEQTSSQEVNSDDGIIDIHTQSIKNALNRPKRTRSLLMNPQASEAILDPTTHEDVSAVSVDPLQSAFIEKNWQKAIELTQSLNMSSLLLQLDTSAVDMDNLYNELTKIVNQEGLERLLYSVNVIIERRLPSQHAIGSIVDSVNTEEKNQTAYFLAKKLVHVAKATNPDPLPHLTLLLLACGQEGIDDLSHVVYLLATAHHESHMGRILEEEAGEKNTKPGEAPFSIYENSISLGNNQAGDGERFHGRGYIHLTGRKNYNRMSQELNARYNLNINLTTNPDQAAEREMAAKIISYGMQAGFFQSSHGKPNSLAKYGSGADFRYREARDIVNWDRNTALNNDPTRTIGELIESNALSYRQAIFNKG